MEVVYEDNHLIIVNKAPGEIVQGDKTGDRPLVDELKQSKALSRMNEMFRNGEVKKTYWAITRNCPPKQADTLTHYITSTERNNKSYASDTEKKGSQRAVLMYRYIASSDRYHLLEINLLTGRKHQIRVQLSAIGCPIKGDLKYGDKRSNPDGSISLLSHRIEFIHPVIGKPIDITAPLPDDNLWRAIAADVSEL